MVDLYLENIRLFGYKDSYNYCDIDVNEIVLSKKSQMEYIIRYYDVNKIANVPLQLKINNFYFELLTFTNNEREIFSYNYDKEHFRKCRKIWNKITELIGINNAPDFVETNLDDDDEFMKANLHKNAVLAEGVYRNRLIIVLHSVFNDCLETSLVRYRC